MDPGRVLVQHAWLDGTPDLDGYVGPGCFNADRGFMEWPAPQDSVPLIDYVTVDPSAGNFWAIEWWCVNPVTMRRYLIWDAARGCAPATSWTGPGGPEVRRA